MLDLAHVGRLRVAIEERPRRLAGIVTGLGEGLSHETIVGAVLRAMIAHPVRQLGRGLGPCHRCSSISSYASLIGAIPVRASPEQPITAKKKARHGTPQHALPRCLDGPGAEGAF